ncbi:MAG: ion transporter [Halobacteriovoraceae bacterium]|nr:ion transporter [Halobacteriovoraceae bacterium]
MTKKTELHFILFKRLWELLKGPEFIGLTVSANLFIILNAAIFYFLEYEENYMIDSFLDAVWWSFTTITTVGYGDIVPVTTIGRIQGILMMLLGTGLFVTFTALFSNAILGRKVEGIQEKVKGLGKTLGTTRKEFQEEEKAIHTEVDQLRRLIAELEEIVNKRRK